nr:reverse transcriptase domain-containing protein [Tanacetum cinerariifolium]
MGESSHDSTLKQHRKQIEEILNHLDELPLDRIERIEDDVEGLDPNSSTNRSGRFSELYLQTLHQPRKITRQLEKNQMPPKKSSTSKASTMSQVAIIKLFADSIDAALETQTATMAEADNSIREIPVAKRGNYKEFISCQPFYFNGTEGVVGLTRLFERIESVFSRSNYAEENKVAFATSTLTNDALSWVPNSEKLMEVFISRLPRSIEGNVTTSKPQTLEEAINTAQRLMDQVTKHNSIQGTNDHK